MKNEMEKVLAIEGKRITPSAHERKRIEALAKDLEKKVGAAAKKLRLKAIVRTEGSVAKDTWVTREPDIDVFMRVPSSIPRAKLGEICLKVAKEATNGLKQIERFADHPYLEVFVDGIRVNIVPCYDVRRGGWISATDRTHFHTDYINKHMPPEKRGEVRLLKKFMKGIDVYGAEIKVGGFSGYLCELLVLYYGSFLHTIESFARNGQKVVVDVADHYRDRREELDLLFHEPLVVVDPVDAVRNVASAVREQKFYTFVAASQMFLRNPRPDFFEPERTIPLNLSRLKQMLDDRGSRIVFIVFRGAMFVPDILWGQLYKSQRSLRKLIDLNGFQVLRDLAWSDEKNLNLFIFELQDCCVLPVKLHLGPPLDKIREGERFIQKHLGNANTVCGPYVENGRWQVLLHRKYTDVCALLRDNLRDGGKEVGVSEGFSGTLKSGIKVLVDEEIDEIYGKNREFAVFLTEFLIGKPKWLVAG